MRRGYAALIGSEPDLETCGEAASAEEALETFSASEADLLICDISLGKNSGLDLVRQLLKRHPALPVLCISMHDESTHARRALAAGARGYMMKSEVACNMVKAVREVLSGRGWLSQHIAKRLDAGSSSQVDSLLPLQLFGLNLPLD